MQENMIEHNIIIREPSKNLRTLGRNALQGKWKVAIIAVIVYLLCIQLPPIIFDNLFGTNIGSVFTSNGYTYGMNADTYAQFYNNMPEYCFLSSIYVILVTGALELGISLFFLATFRKHDVQVTDIFLGFEKFGKALGLFLFQSLFIFLWTLLFVVPGIIASIRYSQAFFILADDPTKGIRQCMDESKAMMKGNKAKYFCLGLSFIGWMILCSIPSGIISSIGNTISSNGFVIGIFSMIGGLCLAPGIVYIYSTMAGFYEILAGHLIKETKPVPVTAEEAKAMYEETLDSAEDTVENFEGAAEGENEEANEATEEASEAVEEIVEEPAAEQTEDKEEEKNE